MAKAKGKAKGKGVGNEIVSTPWPESAEHAEREPEPEKDYIVALGRGLSVVRAFGKQPDRLTLAELSKIVGLPRATVRRCLLTLTLLGYVESSGKYFRLSPQVLTLSQAYLSSTSLPRITQRTVEEISDSVGEPCSVSVLAGDEVVYVARSARRRKTPLYRDVGISLPAYCTSMGRVLLANVSPEELSGYFSRVSLKKFNQKTVVDAATLHSILDQVRKDDYCIIDGELEYDLRAIAVPVRTVSGNVVAAVNVSIENNRLTIKQLQTEVLPIMRQAVSLIRPALVSLS
jgi:IclR family pca regulon transcriptional regulator